MLFPCPSTARVLRAVPLLTFSGRCRWRNGVEDEREGLNAMAWTDEREGLKVFVTRSDPVAGTTVVTEKKVILRMLLTGTAAERSASGGSGERCRAFRSAKVERVFVVWHHPACLVSTDVVLAAHLFDRN
jgi:hypothetical protein